MSSKTDVNRRVLAIQAKKKRKNPKGRGGKPSEGVVSTPSSSSSVVNSNSSSNVALTSRRSENRASEQVSNVRNPFFRSLMTAEQSGLEFLSLASLLMSNTFG
jgi:hypothetical protein